MPEVYRLIEVAVYALLNFLPLAVLALYLFRDALRFSKHIVGLVITVLSGLQIFIGIQVAFFPDAQVGIISLLSTILYGCFFLYVVKAPVGKTLFVLLVLSNLENFLVVSSKCLEGFLFPELARQSYRWSFSLCMVIVLLLLSIPLYVYFKKVIAPVIQLQHNSFDWMYLWLIPAVFYFIWYYAIYLINAESSVVMALNPRNTLVFAIINLGALLVYFVVARLLKINEQNRILEEQKTLHTIQTLQYDKLHEKILETRRTRHDLRHHMRMLSGYVQTQDYEKLQNYLAKYIQETKENTSLLLCRNVAINVVLVYFSEIAQEHGIDFQVISDLSEHVPVPETDLSVLFGNLLENAMDACIADNAEEKKIIVRIHETSAALCFTIDNTFHGRMPSTEDKHIASTKHPGEGLGIDSCRSIVERYRGTLQIRQDGNMVFVSVLMNIHS